MGQVRALIDRGIYDADDIARLARISVRNVSRWASTPSHGGGLLFPTDRRLFTFWDLVTAHVTALLLDRQVPVGNIRDARNHLATRVNNNWPLAHFAVLSRLAHVGANVYFDGAADGEWLDATLSGQAPLPEVVEPLLRRLDFDGTGLASHWRPVEGVVLRPTVQAGAPCVEGTRVSTALLGDLYQQGESIDDLADDYELPRHLVKQAIEYERELAAAA